MHVTHTFRYTVTQTPSNIHNLDTHTRTHATKIAVFFRFFPKCKTSQMNNFCIQVMLYTRGVLQICMYIESFPYFIIYRR